MATTKRRRRTATAANAVTLDTPRIAPAPMPVIPALPTTPGTNGNGDGSLVTAQRRYYAKTTQTNPLRKLKPDSVVRFWDSFQTGYLRDYSLLMEAVAQWDEVLLSVIPKREAAVKRLKWQVLLNEDLKDDQKEEAEAHKEALYKFYNGLTCTHAMDGDVKGGFATFVELAMKSVGQKWAPFEILWKPSSDGLTAEMSYVPLRFFEKRTGKLQFLESDFLTNGAQLVANGWVIFTGPGLMVPSVVCYIIKDMARVSYLCYCQNQGMPGVHGTTEAPYNSAQWNAMFDLLEGVLAGGVILTGPNDKVQKLDVSAQGQLPFPQLIQEANERMATLWRGGALGTVGSGQSGPEQYGVGLQADEETKLAADDGQRLSETLNAVVDPVVIAWTFGEGVKPLAYVKIAPPPTINADRDIKIFDFLNAKGVELGKNQLREHFSVAEPAEDDEPVDKPMVPPAFGGPQVGEDGEEATEDELAAEMEKEEGKEDGEEATAGNERLRRVTLLRKFNTPRYAKALNAILKKGRF